MGGGEVEIRTEGLCDVESTVFVAVGKNVKESKATLLWASQSFAGKKLCLLHVHEPAHLINLLNGISSVNKLKQVAVKVFRELECQKMHKLLNQYLLILAQTGVQAGKVWMEMDNIEKGIVQIITHHGIRWLIMGAAADQHYTEKLSELQSKKATFVCQQAPISCHIWIACNGCLIYTRPSYGNLSLRVGCIETLSSSTGSSCTKLLKNHADADDHADELEQLSMGFTSQLEVQSIRSTDDVAATLDPLPLEMDVMRGDSPLLFSIHKAQGCPENSSSIILLERKSDGQVNSEVLDKLEHAIKDAEVSKQKAFEESVRRWKAEEDAMDAIRKAESIESSCMKLVEQRTEMESALARQAQELERLKNQHDQKVKERQMVRDQKPVLERQLMESCSVEKELEGKIIQAVNLLMIFKEKRDILQTERDKATREVNGLKKLVEEDASDLSKLQFFSFSFWDINEATQDFDPSCKIGDGRYGSVYKGLLHHLKVAIKMLPSGGSQGNLEFEREAWTLSKIRHPNLVTLIGTCSESRSLVYEYVSNGSLEDQLACRGKAPPLSWQTRIRIASEICCALIFLHSSKPSVVHGNLKPTNILLDANFVSKLSDLCMYRLIPQAENSTQLASLWHKTDPETSAYVDPEFLETGEITVKSDVYSFGTVFLRLLTGRPAVGIVKDVKCALERDNFSRLLDTAAGEWPLEQAENLARLALKCCENKRENRPDLVSEVWSVIEQMRKLLTSSYIDSNRSPSKVPSHFVCPIFQEVMKDPQIAADGFTYEADAIKGWLNSGHKTSPMTNLKLDHCDLLPNYALYYAIQEWQQQS